LHNVDEFRNLLQDKSKTKFVITKNKKTINNFLNLNNLDEVIVVETTLNNIKSIKNDSFVIV
jgi:hypothetical protein